MRNEMLKDVRVRQALAHAMDRKKVIDAIRLGHAKPINSIFASASWAFSDDVPKYDYEVAKAKSLLDAAGWRAPANDPNGTRVKDGKPMKMRIFYNAGNKEREQLATIAQQYAKAVGVELEVIAEEWNAYLNRVNRTRDMEMYVLGWSSGLEPHGSQNIWITDGGQNATGFSNAQVDELFPKAAAVPGCSQADRKRVYAEIQKLVSGRSAVHLHVGDRGAQRPQQPPGAEQAVEAGLRLPALGVVLQDREVGREQQGVAGRAGA